MAYGDGCARAVGSDEVVRAGSRFGPEDDIVELGEELGSGAAARVYVGRRLRTGEELAVKVINLQRLRLMGDFDSQMAKLDREVQILRDLRHPRIVRLHNVHRTHSSVFLVMELVRGGELFDRIVQNKSLNEVEAKHVFRQLLEGVGYMHSRNVIHRDLKPENILIASSHPSDPPVLGHLHEVKIADFGLSKIISEETSFAKTFVGTPQYWAPEVLAVQGGYGSYTQACDFWSLGAVLFVMLCGRYPFDGKKTMPLEEQIRRAAFNMNTAAWQKVSEEAKSMVRGLLVVNPAERFTLESCFGHPWLRGMLSAPPRNPRPASPGLMRSVSRGMASVGIVGEVRPVSRGGPEVFEVPSTNVASPAVPLVSQPSHTSDASACSQSHSGSVEQVGVNSPKMSQDSPPQVGQAAYEERPLLGGGNSMPHETIFCLNELLKLQVSIAGSLELAALAFRHTDTELAEAIQNTFWQARELSSSAVDVVSKYAQVAQQVSNDVLPDLDLAVQEKEPSLATSLLGIVKEWVADMKKQGEEIKHRYHGLQESVHSLIQRAQKSKLGSDRRLAEAMESFLPASPRALQQPRSLENGNMGPSPEGLGGPATPASSSTAPASNAVSFSPNSAPANDPVAARPSTLSLPLSMNHWTRQLFEQLRRMQGQGTGARAIQDQIDIDAKGGGVGAGVSAGGSGDDISGAQFTNGDCEAWKRDVLELLFMSPGIVPSQLPKVESVGNFETKGAALRRPSSVGEGEDVAEDVRMGGEKTTSQSSSARPGAFSDASSAVGGAPGDTAVPFVEESAVVRYDPLGMSSPSAAEAMSHSAASLLRALHELKRVDEILEGCAAFWANMDGTVQKLAQMKEHTECLVNFASKSKPLKDRFDQRLGDYRNFWSSLERLCRQYCLDHQASAKRMYEVIREVSDVADVIDTVNSSRVGLQLSVMREKQRRHGY
mmetsp:Transcript_28670/g.82361  ORF Transcript_28670/g.82361 Transcript_28670/m.82361 type:complete len:943 (-) Transcript_28670:109-2937(-)